MPKSQQGENRPNPAVESLASALAACEATTGLLESAIRQPDELPTAKLETLADGLREAAERILPSRSSDGLDSLLSEVWSCAMALSGVADCAQTLVQIRGADGGTAVLTELLETIRHRLEAAAIRGAGHENE